MHVTYETEPGSQSHTQNENTSGDSPTSLNEKRSCMEMNWFPGGILCDDFF